MLDAVSTQRPIMVDWKVSIIGTWHVSIHMWQNDKLHFDIYSPIYIFYDNLPKKFHGILTFWFEYLDHGLIQMIKPLIWNTGRISISWIRSLKIYRNNIQMIIKISPVLLLTVVKLRHKMWHLRYYLTLAILSIN